MTLRSILIRQIIRNKYGVLEQCAWEWGVTRSYVSAICRGKRKLPWWAAGDLGLET